MDFKQLTGYWCGPASLKVIMHLAAEKDPNALKPLGQCELALMAQTDNTGTGIKGLKKALRAMGHTYTPHTGKLKLTGKEPDTMIVWEKARNHWMVAQRLWLQEPKEGWFWQVYDPELGSTWFQSTKEFQKTYLNKSYSYCLFVEF